ncbi:hypothetical protein FIBSPDRAFT_903505 [Athelia psychrophila]|uniref:Uncharacterized protein n=1 Tax=Athelia psychrophila TaxID=1759441 RepID=A0A167VVU0_9AGAM|nr:hypothetical protein FIBSPDRAFT_903505 [Fibularhizoctonia sp. CBS 109695]
MCEREGHWTSMTEHNLNEKATLESGRHMFSYDLICVNVPMEAAQHYENSSKGLTRGQRDIEGGVRIKRTRKLDKWTLVVLSVDISRGKPSSDIVNDIYHLPTSSMVRTCCGAIKIDSGWQIAGCDTAALPPREWTKVITGRFRTCSKVLARSETWQTGTEDYVEVVACREPSEAPIKHRSGSQSTYTFGAGDQTGRGLIDDANSIGAMVALLRGERDSRTGASGKDG